jgi:hypothetical protein
MDAVTAGRINKLHPKIREEVRSLVEQANAALTGNAQVRIVQGYRTFSEQDAEIITELTTDKITLKAQKQAKNSENWFWRVVALLAIGWAVFKPKIIKIVNQLKGKL